MANSKIFNGLTIYGNLEIDGNFVFPTIDGSNGQVMVTDGAGTLTWQTVSGGTGGSGATFSSTDNYVSGVTQTITHNLNSTNVIVQLIDTGNNEMIEGYVNNYQPNSIDVTLTQTLNNIKTVVAGGVFVGTSGGTGSPAGSDTWVQYNDAGSFGATSGLTWDGSSAFTVTTTVSGKTQGISVGNINLSGLEFAGASITHKNPLSGGTSGLWVGDTFDDGATIVGYVDIFNNDIAALFSSAQGYVSMSRQLGNNYSAVEMENPEDLRLIASTDSGNTYMYVDALDGVAIEFDSSGQTSTFKVRDSSRNITFMNVGSGGTTTIKGSGTTGQHYMGINGVELFGSNLSELSGMFYVPNTGDTVTGMYIGDATSVGFPTPEGLMVLGRWDSGDTKNSRAVFSERSVLLSYDDPTLSGGTAMQLNDDGVTVLVPNTSGTSEFKILDDSFSEKFTVNRVGEVTINNAYTLPTVNGNDGEVLTANASGFATWTTVSGGTSGTSIMVAGTGSDSTIRDNVNNTASAYRSAALAGENNSAEGSYSIIGGGSNNGVSGDTSFIGGGGDNKSYAKYSVVGGGFNNINAGQYSFIGGGINNIASGTQSVVVGGCNNTASGNYSGVVGGNKNTSQGQYSTISGGYFNTATNILSFIGGGNNNTTSGNYSTIGGGVSNTASGVYSSVLGGVNNVASGYYSAVLAGSGLTAGFNTAAVPNLDINGDLRLIGSTTGLTLGFGTLAVPSSATTIVQITLNGIQYGLPLYESI